MTGNAIEINIAWHISDLFILITDARAGKSTYPFSSIEAMFHNNVLFYI